MKTCRVLSLQCTRQSLSHCGLRGQRNTAALLLAQGPSPLHSAYRHWTNPFANFFSGNSSASSSNKANSFSPKSTKATVAADQLSERLTDSCLDILELLHHHDNAAGSDALDDHSKQIYFEVCQFVMYQYGPEEEGSGSSSSPQGKSEQDSQKKSIRTPSDQFDLVYLALCLPYTETNIALQKNLFTVLESILPNTLYRVFENCPRRELFILQEVHRDLDEEEGELDDKEEKVLVLQRFVHALLGDMDVYTSTTADNRDPLTTEEVLSVYLEDFEHHFPSVVQHTSFAPLRDVHALSKLHLQAKLFETLTQLCRSFDAEGTGRVKLEDLRECSERVLGKEKTVQLLKDAPVDEEGRLRYAQLTMLLTRPPSEVRQG